jgi:hypothetical protein
MPGIGLKIDPVGEDAANVALDINDGVKFRAMKASYPTPARKVNWASSVDTEGALPASLQYENRQITIECRVYGSSASDLQTQLGYLEQKVGKINEEEGVGGTHEYVSPSGVTCIFDLLEGSADYELDNTALANRRTVVTITFTAKPFWRSGLANEVAGIDHVETTKPAVIGLDIVNGGDVPAIARLVVDDDQGVDQWSLLWGLQSRNYSGSADAELFYEAETRTLQGGSELKALSGASGSGSNAVLNGLLFPTFQPILSTQKVGGGNHFSHVGTYRVYARLFRPTTNNGEVTVAFQWAQGDFQQSTLNEEKHWEQNEFEGNFTLTDLGLVNIDKAAGGTQRWEGHVLAKSTQPGDDIYIDCLLLFPVDEGFGTLQTEPLASSLTTVSAHDEFDQTPGNLDLPKVLPVGGSWSEAGKVAAEGFTVNSTFKWAQRTVVSDGGFPGGTFAIAGATTSPFASVSALLGATTLVYLESQQGLFLRYTNASNWLKAVIEGQPPFNKIVVSVYKMVAGSQVAMEGLGDVLGGISSFSQLKLTLSAFPSGRYRVECNGHVLEGYDPDLATGGALATGKAGMYDMWASAKACTRSFDNFQLLTGTPDAAVYAGRSAEVRSTSMQRYDSTGAVLSRRGDYKGAYIQMPPARREARPVRTIVKLSRGEVDSLPDGAIDDASFRIFWQPRGLVLPES